MKKHVILLSAVYIISIHGIYAQNNARKENVLGPAKQKIGIVVYSNDAETVWNAFRLANYSLNQKDSVSVFLLGKGVEAPVIKDKEFDVKEQLTTFSESGGRIMACGTCLRLRNTEGSKLCPVSSMSDLYEMIKTNDKIVTF